jgi:hypothetical protein
MAQQHLDHPNVDALFEQVGGDPRVKPGDPAGYAATRAWRCRPGLWRRSRRG